MASYTNTCIDHTQGWSDGTINTSDIADDVDYVELKNAVNTLQSKLKSYPSQCACDNNCACDYDCGCNGTHCACNSENACSCNAQTICSPNCTNCSCNAQCSCVSYCLCVSY